MKKLFGLLGLVGLGALVACGQTTTTTTTTTTTQAPTTTTTTAAPTTTTQNPHEVAAKAFKEAHAEALALSIYTVKIEDKAIVLAAQEAFEALSKEAKEDFASTQGNLLTSLIAKIEALEEAALEEGKEAQAAAKAELLAQYGGFELEIAAINEDAGGDAIALWTEGAIRTYSPENPVTEADGDTNWVGNGWRYYVVVDAEGLVMYATVHPAHGYGDPNNPGGAYACHPNYAADYTKNPAIQLLEGFGPWVAGTDNYRRYNIVVPEGGFALTAHGTAIPELVKALNLNAEATFEDTLAGAGVVNTTKLDNGLRLAAFDLNKEVLAYDLTQGIAVNAVNADAGADAVAVWTEGKLREYKAENAVDGTGDHNWVGNGWRLYAIVDADGKLMYASVNPGTSYGNPIGNGYYCHPDYADYTKNPAVVPLEGYSGWVAGQKNHLYFDLIVPEGCFAITAHGTAVAPLVELFTAGEKTYVGNDSIAILNAKNAYASNLRLYYNAELGEVTAKFEMTEQNGLVLTVGNYTSETSSGKVWFETSRHWVVGEAGEDGFMANTNGNSDGFYGYSYNTQWANPGFVANKGVALVLDAAGKIVYAAIATEGVDVVVSVKDGVVTKAALGHTDVLKDINTYLPVGGKVLFASDKGPNVDLPNLALKIATELATWDEAAILNNVVTLG